MKIRKGQISKPAIVIALTLDEAVRFVKHPNKMAEKMRREIAATLAAEVEE